MCIRAVRCGASPARTSDDDNDAVDETPEDVRGISEGDGLSDVIGATESPESEVDIGFTADSPFPTPSTGEDGEEKERKQGM